MTQDSAKPRVRDAGLFSRAAAPFSPPTQKRRPGSRSRGGAASQGGSLFCQLNITTSSRGASAGSTARAVSTGPTAPGACPW